MGMFDSLYVNCPCGKKVEFQSKAGDCHCDNFTLFDCPPAIAGDLIGQSEHCECGRTVTLRGKVLMEAEFYPQNDDAGAKP